MHCFKDMEGRDWELGLTIGSIKRVRGVLGIDLLNLQDGDPPLLTMLALDVELLVNVIFVLVRPQAAEIDVSDEQFGEALGGEAILAAHDAFYAEMEDFYRSLGRNDMVAAIEAQKEVIDVAVSQGTKQIQAQDLAGLVEKLSGEPSTNSQPTPESSPAHSP